MRQRFELLDAYLDTLIWPVELMAKMLILMVLCFGVPALCFWLGFLVVKTLTG